MVVTKEVTELGDGVTKAEKGDSVKFEYVAYLEVNGGKGKEYANLN